MPSRVGTGFSRRAPTNAEPTWFAPLRMTKALSVRRRCPSELCPAALRMAEAELGGSRWRGSPRSTAAGHVRHAVFDGSGAKDKASKSREVRGSRRPSARPAEARPARPGPGGKPSHPRHAPDRKTSARPARGANPASPISRSGAVRSRGAGVPKQSRSPSGYGRRPSAAMLPPVAGGRVSLVALTGVVPARRRAGYTSRSTRPAGMARDRDRLRPRHGFPRHGRRSCCASTSGIAAGRPSAQIRWPLRSISGAAGPPDRWSRPRPGWSSTSIARTRAWSFAEGHPPLAGVDLAGTSVARSRAGELPPPDRGKAHHLVVPLERRHDGRPSPPSLADFVPEMVGPGLDSSSGALRGTPWPRRRAGAGSSSTISRNRTGRPRPAIPPLAPAQPAGWFRAAGRLGRAGGNRPGRPVPPPATWCASRRRG